MTGPLRDRTLHELGERVKELTALHNTARIIQDRYSTPLEVMQAVADLLPGAWQYPAITAGAIEFDDLAVTTPGYRETPWSISSRFALRSGKTGRITVAYLEEKPPAHEGPFLLEERHLIDSMAEMLNAYFQRVADEASLERARDGLEIQVRERTRELRETNLALEEEITEHHRARAKVEAYQNQLRRLATELILTEERQRRDIATGLHDHIGQSLAFIKMKLSSLRGEAVFTGLETTLEEILDMLNQTIRDTRTLTFEISSPVLYDLGLIPALEWLAEQYSRKHSVHIRVEEHPGPVLVIPDGIKVMLFTAARELVTNAIKHSNSRRILIEYLPGDESLLQLTIKDNGVGFDVDSLESSYSNEGGFGLFSIRERITHMGGTMQLHSAPGEGTDVTIRLTV